MDRGVLGSESFAGLPSLSVAAHELKSPIALMRQLSLAILEEDLSDEQRSRLKQMVVTADRSLRLVTDLSHVSSLQSALFPLEPVNPLAVCQTIVSEMRPMARLYGHGITWVPSRSNSLVVANRHLLGRVVSNFLDNAMKYTEQGMPISLSVSRSRESLRVNVRDYGPRMGSEEYRRMLDELETKKTLKTRPDSSGLGIFLASEFAKTMHGRIGLIRHRDGVTFYVELPVSRQMSWL